MLILRPKSDHLNEGVSSNKNLPHVIHVYIFEYYGQGNIETSENHNLSSVNPNLENFMSLDS
jgi:hypothetical protein